MQCACAILATVTCPALKHFSTLPHKRHDFRKTLLKIGHLEEPGVDGRIIIRWVFRKWDVEVWTGSSRLRIGAGGGEL